MGKLKSASTKFPRRKRNKYGNLIIKVPDPDNPKNKVVVSHGTSPRLLEKFWRVRDGSYYPNFF